MSFRNIADAVLLLLVVMVVMFLWRQADYELLRNDESLLAFLIRPR